MENQCSHKNGCLKVLPPFIWPDTRISAGQLNYEHNPPIFPVLSEADIISGVIVGPEKGSIQCLERILESEHLSRMYIVLVVYPAGPTGQSHLMKLLELCKNESDKARKLDFRVLPMSNFVNQNHQKMALPPTNILVHKSKTGNSVLCIGSVGDIGNDALLKGSFNVVFQPEYELRDNWRKWFQFVHACAAPLTIKTAKIPSLIPAKGDPEAERLWFQYNTLCNKFINHKDIGSPTVDSETGEVTHEIDGNPVVPWDEGKIVLDSLALKFQQIYANAYLATIDETSRIKPLDVPVKAKLLGQFGERSIGNITHRQSFTLRVLDENDAKKLDTMRKVTSTLNLFSYPLSKGNRLIPIAAIPLIEKEIDKQNSIGFGLLKKSLKNNTPKRFVEENQNKIRVDLNQIYFKLGMGNKVPNDKFEEILNDVVIRLEDALKGRFTPRIIYNRLSAPDLTTSALPDNWSQPYSIILNAAKMMRSIQTDPYFNQTFSKLITNQDEFIKAMNIFNDKILKSDRYRIAHKEIEIIKQIENSDMPPKDKCYNIWDLLRFE